ncbi:MAG: hypothetical protein EBV34_10785 [Betaproteobacteria bacterium]|nr:hypothetical protein [Betaproteobacteria bacterium]
MLDYNQINEFLSGLGITGESPVFLHSSFKPFREIGFTTSDVINLMLRKQKGKALMMPAFNWRAVGEETPFDVVNTPSIVGGLSESFRRYEGVVRTIHPTHSCSIELSAINQFGNRHELSCSPCDLHSPFATFADNEVRLVMMNCDIESLTYIHHLEETTYPEVYLNPKLFYTFIIDEDGINHGIRQFKRHSREPRNFSKFKPTLVKQPSYKQFSCGQLFGWSINSKDLHHTIKKAFSFDIYATLR